MNAIVVGLGSMGRRRCRLLAAYDKKINIAGIDNREDRRIQAEEELGIRTYSSINEAFIAIQNADIAFVSTSPLEHGKIIHECLERGIHTFSEINLVNDMYDENISLANKKGLTLFLSSTPMYRKEIEYIKKIVRQGDTGISYLYHVGQYLPDWHPWESYKDFFVGKKKTSGCREIMAIEFPWLFDVFGEPIQCNVQSLRSAQLDIDYPDVFQIMIIHSGGSKGLIQVDVTSRKAVRSFDCISENYYISWDGTPYGLYSYNPETKNDVQISLYNNVEKRSDYSKTIIEDAYYDEIREFMDVIKGSATARHTFERDKQILKIIDEIGA